MQSVTGTDLTEEWRDEIDPEHKLSHLGERSRVGSYLFNTLHLVYCAVDFAALHLLEW